MKKTLLFCAIAIAVLVIPLVSSALGAPSVDQNRLEKIRNSQKIIRHSDLSHLSSQKKGRFIIQLKQPKLALSKLNLSSLKNRNTLRNANLERLQRAAAGFENEHIRVRKSLGYFMAFSANVSLEGLEQLLLREDIEAIYEDTKLYPSLKQGIPLIGPGLSRNNFGGQGVSIAILDTGIDYYHPFLGGGPLPNWKIIGGIDTGEDDLDPIDIDGHGTSVAGIAAGIVPDDQDTDYIGGVAPEAKLYAVKISEADGDQLGLPILQRQLSGVSHTSMMTPTPLLWSSI